jgi:hypothetical protein
LFCVFLLLNITPAYRRGAALSQERMFTRPHTHDALIAQGAAKTDFGCSRLQLSVLY